MKREFLKGLGIEGLTDEVIDKIMAENGKDIEKQKQAAEKSTQIIENLKAEIESKDTLLNEANSQIEKFKEMDIDSIKKNADEYKAKYEEGEAKAKEEKAAFEKALEAKDYEFAVKDFASQYKFANDFVKEAFINKFNEQQFKLNEGKFLGADDYVKQFDESNPGVFVKEEDKKGESNDTTFPQIVSPTGGSDPIDTKAFSFNFTGVRPHDEQK